MTNDLRDQLIAACPNTLAGKRDRAMIALGYDTLCRRAELVALLVEDLRPPSNGSAQILIRRSKNDPYGEGRLGYVSPESLKLVHAWLNAEGIDAGYIFRAVRHDRAGNRPLHPYSVNRILKQAARAAGLSAQAIEHLSGHSMRVIATLGRADELDASGALASLLASGAKLTDQVLLINALDEDADGALSASAKRIGGPLLFGKIWERLGIADILGDLLQDRAFEFAVERAVFVATLHRVFVSGSDRDCSSRLEDYDIAGSDGLDLHHFSIAPWPGSARRWRRKAKTRSRHAAPRT
ncbi:MAG: tyrosine-type recombinase/integrase [Methylocystis sp.]